MTQSVNEYIYIYIGSNLNFSLPISSKSCTLQLHCFQWLYTLQPNHKITGTTCPVMRPQPPHSSSSPKRPNTYHPSDFPFSRKEDNCFFPSSVLVCTSHSNIHNIVFRMMMMMTIIKLWIAFIALFSALEQTHCTHVTCDSE